MKAKNEDRGVAKTQLRGRIKDYANPVERKNIIFPIDSPIMSYFRIVDKLILPVYGVEAYDQNRRFFQAVEDQRPYAAALR